MSCYRCSKRGFLSGSENNTNVTSPHPAPSFFLLLWSLQYHSAETRVSSKPSVTRTQNASGTVAARRLQLSNSFTVCLGSTARYANALTYANYTAKCWFEMSEEKALVSLLSAKKKWEAVLCVSMCVWKYIIDRSWSGNYYYWQCLPQYQSGCGSVSALNPDRCARLKQQLDNDLEKSTFITLQTE